MAKQIVKISESKLRSLVESCVRETLDEKFFSGIADKVKDGFNTVKNKVDDVVKGYPTREGNPTSERDVFEGDGWKVVDETELPNGKEFSVRRTSGGMGAFYGKEIEEMVEELDIFLNGRGKAEYVGKEQGGVELFRINYR